MCAPLRQQQRGHLALISLSAQRPPSEDLLGGDSQHILIEEHTIQGGILPLTGHLAG